MNVQLLPCCNRSSVCKIYGFLAKHLSIAISVSLKFKNNLSKNKVHKMIYRSDTIFACHVCHNKHIFFYQSFLKMKP